MNMLGAIIKFILELIWLIICMLRGSARGVFGLAYYSPLCSTVLCRSSGSGVLKQTPEIYYNWIGSNWSLKGVAE
mgnify:CR=1 FL=1